MLNYARQRIGASSYVALTDLPEKVIPPPKPEPEEGEEAAAAAEGEEEAPPPEAEEPVEPPPKFKPSKLQYVAATSNDEKLMVGKELLRPAADDPEAEEPVITRGAGEGVTFDAIDDFLAGGTKVLHIPRAVENRSVKFFYVPRLGGYACEIGRAHV